MINRSLFTSEPFIVAAIQLADFGRKEIELAEYEMPGLMSFGPASTVRTDIIKEKNRHATFRRNP